VEEEKGEKGGGRGRRQNRFQGNSREKEEFVST